MTDPRTSADSKQEEKHVCTDDGSIREGRSVAAEGISQNECKKEVDESCCSNSTAGGHDENDLSLLDMVETFSADIEAYREAADELETMSESVKCLMRNTVNGDGRPAGVWKDVC